MRRCWRVEQRHDPCALGPGVIQVVLQPLQLSGIDDCAVVGVVGQARIQAQHGLTVGADEALEAPARHQHVIRRNAGLPGIHALAEGDALGGIGQRHRGRGDGGRLAAQLEGDRGEVVGSGTHHVTADRGRAGEQQMVERQAGKGSADLHVAEHHRHLILGEHLREQRFQQLTGGRCRLAHLQHHAVAGRERADQRADGQVERVVPRHDDPHHPSGW